MTQCASLMSRYAKYLFLCDDLTRYLFAIFIQFFFRLFFQLKRKSASYRVPADHSPDSSPITVTKNTSSRNVMVALKSISEVDSKLEKDGSKTNSVNESLKDDCLIKVLSMHTLIDLPAIDLKK